MVNYYSQKCLDKLRICLKDSGYTKDIPLYAFRQGLMLTFGMNRKTGDCWIRNFEETSIITVTRRNDEFGNDTQNWLVNFK